MTRWTPQQMEAIEARNREVLVSAAAGSGKTSVLIERVLALLRDGADLDRLLIITFTKAAAGEMRARLTDSLQVLAQDSEDMRRQYALLGRADISTLHAFCEKIVRRHFQAAETDPLSRVADEALQRELFEAALSAEMDAMYEAPDADAQALTDNYRDEQITRMASALHAFLMAQDAPWAWLDARMDELARLDLYAHPWQEVMRREALLTVSGAKALLERAGALSREEGGPRRYETTLGDDLAIARQLEGMLQKGGLRSWEDVAFGRLPTKAAPPEEDPAKREAVKGLRDQAKKLLREALALFPKSDAEAAAWAREMQETLPALRALARLVNGTHARYQEAKAVRALWDFGDLEHMALKALSAPGIAEAASSEYDALFVDEYQDISLIQEAVIQSLHRGENTLFMVGDIKQSIYRFRLADPTLFLRKYGRFEQGEDAQNRLILLSENFRSVPNVLAAVNLVFEYAMREGATELAYDEQARLKTLREGADDPPVELWLIEKGDHPAEETEEDLQPADAEDAAGDEPGEAPAPPPHAAEGEMERAYVYEARLIARRIRDLLDTPIREGDGVRPLRKRDVAVLLRTASGRAGVMAQILSEEGIAAYSDAEGEFFTQGEVRDAMALLGVVDNPYDDEQLLSALSCPAFSFTPDELARVRLSDPGRDVPFHAAFLECAQKEPHCKAAQEAFDRWRFLADNMPLADFIRLVLRESGLYAAAGAGQDGSLRRANLRALAQRAERSTIPMTLGQFVQRMNRTAAHRGRDRSASLGMEEDVVRIMTLHKAKGLEFPVVFLPDLAAEFSRRRPPQQLYLDAATGLAIEHVQRKAHLRKDTWGVRAIKLKRAREELSEEARLLYVGMTRARERLVLIGAPANLEGAMARWAQPPSDFSAGSARSMLDWVAPPLYAQLALGAEGLHEAPGGSRWQVSYVSTAALAPTPQPVRPSPPAEESAEKGEEVRRILSLPMQRTTVPLKTSVTALVTGRAGIEPGDEETPATKRMAETRRPPSPQPRLQGEQALTGAERGAAAHKALGALDPADFAGLAQGAMRARLKDELDAMQGRGLLLPPEREAVDEEAILGFLSSGLANRMADSGERHREWRFTLRVEGGLIIQGVLDACFLEDGAWVLIDFKTDYGNAEDLAERYRDQMRWYMRALRDITGTEVREAWLYLLRATRAVRVTEDAPIRLGLAEPDAEPSPEAQA
ncbi:MAG TPA: UvrD-helicase domain-containing protein [Candidatus Limnocylindria bacterium]|nr:UvrD-helicase domain-containing protein [Candidatus Limnocylindria bacterium]